MTRYISLLRGINVGGGRKIKMEDLKHLYESLNLRNVITYIQSGNVIFDVDSGDTSSLIKIVEDKIIKDLGLDVSILLRNQDQLNVILLNNPFLKNDAKDPTHLYVTFLSGIPDNNQIDKLKEFNYAPDEFRIAGSEIYVYCPNGYERTKLNNSFFENKLKLKATSRNWRTINILNEMMVLEKI